VSIIEAATVSEREESQAAIMRRYRKAILDEIVTNGWSVCQAAGMYREVRLLLILKALALSRKRKTFKRQFDSMR